MEIFGEELLNELEYVDLVDEDEYGEDTDPGEETEFDNDAPVINGAALGALTHFLQHVHSYYNNLPSIIKDMHVNPTDYEGELNICYPKSIHKILNISSKQSPQMQPDSMNVPMGYSTRTHNDCLVQLSFVTLPLIYNIEPLLDGNYQNVRYYTGLSLPEFESMIQPADVNNEE